MSDPFRQAEAQYQQLTSALAAQQISPEVFRDQLAQIRVTDTLGRTWMMQQGSGRWFVWQDGQWQAASPYPVAPSAPPSAAPGAPAYAQAQQRTQALPPLEGGWGKLFVNTLKALLLAILIFIVIGVLIATFADDFGYGDIPKVMIAPVLLSAIISFFTMSGQWRGRILEFGTKRVRETDDDDGTVSYRYVRYARLQLENGRTKDISPSNDWDVGDIIEKRRGEMSAKKVG